MPPRKAKRPPPPEFESPADIQSETPSKRATPDPNDLGTTVTGTTSKVPAIVLQRRREGRIRAMEKLQTKLDALGIKRTDTENNLTFSSIPVIQLINQKNYYTDYLKKDEQAKIVRENKEKLNEKRNSKIRESELKKQDIISKLKANSTATPDLDDDQDDDDDDDEGKVGSKTFIFHPGSENIRIGLSSEVDPIVVPNIIAYKLRGENQCNYSSRQDPERVVDETTGDLKITNEFFLKNKKAIQSNFRERMKYYKRRILPNSNETCYNYNKKVTSEIIKDHDDVLKVEYLKTKDQPDCVIGDDVFKLDDLDKWMIRSPFLSGHFNDKDLSYTSQQEILGDVQTMLTKTLSLKFGISGRKTLNSYNCIFIIPNLYDKSYVESMFSLLLTGIGFGQVTILQEGLAATFGTGISTACVVDIGATSTKICCIEDGLIAPNSAIELSYGGSDITRFFTKNLITQQFPYKDVNLNNIRDWNLMKSLKEKTLTFNDANVAVQLFNFVTRGPGLKTEKFEFKCFDEVMVSPMGLFYPDVFLENKGTSIKDDIASNAMLLGKLQPAKKIHAPLFGQSGCSDGLLGGANLEALCQSGHSTDGKSICSMDLVELIDHLVIHPPVFTSSNNNTGNNELNDDADDDQLTNSTGPTSTGLGGSSNATSNTENGSSSSSSSASDGISIDFQKNMTPLEQAIIQSITYSSFSDQARLERLYSNILIVGGGGKLEGLDGILIDRLHMARSGLLASNKLAEVIKVVKQWKDEALSDGSIESGEFRLSKSQIQELNSMIVSGQLSTIEILSNSKDIDPAMLICKGGSVFSRLKIADELWVDEKNWDELGVRCFNYTCLFNY
ncbi:hypothetical protein CANARDRAFT_30283 [[Candida] arabinofermentans NRRL YB-2248]|uniref:Uncharacterized protein n=1 Tax=[Candida] arabinofermentans NRRL YB-2248 TaxID=983967 RepID=A0A1E4SU67_9ASCO|nr:hypothetical protein CANARDRAFT_30283 [[Candida] arabinofermentans NRRL YB-2248]